MPVKTMGLGDGRAIAAACAVVVAISGAGALSAAPALSFDRVFAISGEPAAMHYRVVYVGGQGVHRMEVWRDRDLRVRRVTDGELVSLATHEPGGAGYQLTILDRRRRVATKVDRTNLYRVGNFADWFDLTHGLRHPKGGYTLAQIAAPAGLPATPAPCSWYRLVEGRRATSICWDRRNRLPLLIATADGRSIWRVTQMDSKPSPAATFALDLRGYTINNANRDIEGD